MNPNSTQPSRLMEETWMKLASISVRWDGLIFPLALFAAMGPCRATGTPAGTILNAISKVFFTDTKTLSITAQEAPVIVANKPAITVTLQRSADNVGGATAIPCTITNSGNGPDTIRVSVTTSPNTYAILVKDPNADGIWQPTESEIAAQLTDLPPDKSVACLLVVQSLSGTAVGSTGTATVAAVSGVDRTTQGVATFTATYVKRLSASFSFQAPEPLSSSPTIVGGLALVGSDAGAVYAVHTTGVEAGKLAWRYPPEGNLGAAVRGRVASDGAGYYFACEDGFAYRLNSQGGLAWRSQVVAPGTRMDSMPLAGQDLVTIACGDGRVRCLDKQTGEVIGASAAVGGGALTTPSMPLIGDIWLGGADGHLYNIKADKAFTVKSTRYVSQKGITAPPFVDTRTGLVLTCSPDGDVYSLQNNADSVRWGPVALGSPVKGSPWVDTATGIAYLAGTDNTIHALYVSNGQAVPGYPVRLPDGGGFEGAPVVDPLPNGDSVLFTASTTGRVYGFRPADPRHFVQFDAPGVQFLGTPALSGPGTDGVLVVAGTDGRLYGFRAADAVAP